jgi:hypothetical protein
MHERIGRVGCDTSDHFVEQNYTLQAELQDKENRDLTASNISLGIDAYCLIKWRTKRQEVVNEHLLREPDDQPKYSYVQGHT